MQIFPSCASAGATWLDLDHHSGTAKPLSVPAWDLWPLVDAALKEITPGEGVGDFCCQGCSSRWLWHVMACYGTLWHVMALRTKVGWRMCIWNPRSCLPSLVSLLFFWKFNDMGVGQNLYILTYFFGWTEGHQGFDTHMFSEDFGSQQLPNGLLSLDETLRMCNVDELSPQTRVMQKWLAWLCFMFWPFFDVVCFLMFLIWSMSSVDAFLRHPNLQVGGKIGKTSPVSFSVFCFTSPWNVRTIHPCQTARTKTLFFPMPKRIRRQRPECGIPVESGNDRRLLKKGFPEQFFLVGDSGTFFLLCLVANCLHGLSWHFPSLWVARLLTPSCAVGWFQAQPQKSPWKPEMVRRLGSGNIGNHDLSKPPNNPTTDLAKPHRSFSFWDFPALLQLHVGTRGMGPEFFLRGPFKQPNLKPQTLEILGFEKGPKCHGSCISLLLLHLEQSQAQHGVVFAQVFGFPGCQAQPCASGSQDLNDTRSHRGSMGY